MQKLQFCVTSARYGSLKHGAKAVVTQSFGFEIKNLFLKLKSDAWEI